MKIIHNIGLGAVITAITICSNTQANAQQSASPMAQDSILEYVQQFRQKPPKVTVDELDDRLLKELYNHDLFDYMYDEIISNSDSINFVKTVETDVLAQRLKAMNAATPFNVEYNIVLEALIAKYLSRNKNYMERVMTVSDYYFPMIEATLDKHNIPLEMKYLAIVESSLNPRAKSGVGATGMWQFMYGTGKDFNLEVTSYMDERMDPLKATEAACKYLNSLYKVYGDWDLVLAAYNCGPGNVNKAIRRSGGSTNYWKLRPYLPKETANYAPAFQATMYIYEYAKEHGYQPEATAFKRIETDTIVVRNKIALERVAQYLDLDFETVQFFNPSYKLDIIPVIPGKANLLRLPREAVARFVENEDDIYDFAATTSTRRLSSLETATAVVIDPDKPITYIVKKDDILSKIADEHNVGVAEIKAWNNLRSNQLNIGQELRLHPKTAVAAVKEKKQKFDKVHVVRKGESYWGIARKYGVTIVTIRKMNPDIKALKPGVKLRLS